MTKQELLECIAPYLPYNVKLICDYIYKGFKCELVVCNSTNSLKNGMDINECINDNAKLILRPLSDLTKPCLGSGKVPIVELANILKPTLGWHMSGDHCVSSGCSYFFYYNDHEFCLANSDGDNVLFNQSDCFKFMYKHHFDIHNLIKQGYAIDINTLKSE